MIFDTYWFIVAVFLFLPIYWIAGHRVLRLIVLLSFCFLFHSHFAGASGMLPIMILALLTYVAGVSRNRILCLLTVVFCAIALCFYKYSRFFVNDVIAPMNADWAKLATIFLDYVLPVAPPLAISFFAFEFVHYLMEVRKGGKPMLNPIDFMQFTVFFPSLVAGPIKRYGQFIPSLHKGLSSKISGDEVVNGLLQVAFGYFQKVVLADNLSNYIAAKQDFFGHSDYTIFDRWTFLTFLALRIFFDFNGYSDIAIGLARMLGIQLPPNFNRPYAARNIRDFWQRWHISLSSWIRDYIYVPLGGGRRGPARKALNGIIAFALCGLWHGAAWNFVVWGLYHGVGLAVSSFYRSLPVVRLLGPLFDKFPLLAWFVTLCFVFFGWLLFFYPLPRAWEMFTLLFGGFTG